MDFLANKVEYLAPKATTPLSSIPARIVFAIAGMVICVELLILWQFVQPASLMFREPTQAPRPQEDRMGILKRF